MIFQFGKYKGTHINDVPDDYLDWLIRDCQDKLNLYKGEKDRRQFVVDNSWMMKIIESGYKTVGISNLLPPETQKLDAAYKLLKQSITDAGKVDS